MMTEKRKPMEGLGLKRSWSRVNGEESHCVSEEDSEEHNESHVIIKRGRKDEEFTDGLGNTELNISCYNREHSLGSGTDDSVEVEAVDTRGSTDSALSNSEETTDDEDDNVSEISDLSGISIEGWRSVSGPMAWVQQQMMSGKDPLLVLRSLIPDDTHIPSQLDDLTLWKIIINLLSEPPRRNKLSHVNTLDDVVSLMRSCKNIMVLTGAGVSVSCGIPDFRSRDGIYARLAQEYPDLPDPQAMFDITYFRRNPKPFFKFAKEIYPGQFKPSLCHRFVKLLEDQGKLLRNYTQNIDTLEQVAGISRVIQCHGSFATATCMNCKWKVKAEAIQQDIMNQIIPSCGQCDTENPVAIMKPDIVFFGESLSEEFHRQMELDRDQCDLLIVIGSSLKVRPVALVPNSLPANIPQILINREPLRHLNFDVELLGDCDIIINELCHKLGEGWTDLCTSKQSARQTTLEEYYPMYVASAQKDDIRLSSTDDSSQMSVTDTQTDSQVEGPPDDTDSTVFSLNLTGDDSRSSINMTDCSQNLVQVNCVESTSVDIDSESVSSFCKQSNELENQTIKESNTDSAENFPLIHTDNSNLNTNLLCSRQQSDTFYHNQSVNIASQQNVAITQTKTETPPQSQGSLLSCSHQSENDAFKNKDPTNLSKNSPKNYHTIHSECSSSWQPKYIIVKYIPESLYVYMEPCRYIFHGAEVRLDVDNSDSVVDNAADSDDDLDNGSLEPSSQDREFSPAQAVSLEQTPTKD